MASLILCQSVCSPAKENGKLHTPLRHHSWLLARAFSCQAKRGKNRSVSVVNAISKNDLDELEMQVAILNQEMLTAAGSEKFEEAAKFRDRLENLRLKQRCMQVEHREGLRDSICHHIGQLMQHKKYRYRGVIIGSHSLCEASESWIQSMGVDTLSSGRHQPFYQVLVDERDRAGGMMTYVAQENIAAFEGDEAQPNAVQHKQIKKMFSGFDAATKRFIPTKELLGMYPDSIEAREQRSTDD